MKASLNLLTEDIREAYLVSEERCYQKAGGTSFTKIKDWDETGPTVIWQGLVNSDLLSGSYKIQIHYDSEYPFSRPKIFPIEPRIENQRHQNPTEEGSDLPGDLCLFPHAPDYWRVGMTCEEIIQRVIKWLLKYETKTLDDEFAPPEIERYFPASRHIRKPTIIIAQTLLDFGEQRSGACILVPTRSGAYAFLSLIRSQKNDEQAIEEIFRLSALMLPHDRLDSKKMERGSWFRIHAEPRIPVPASITDMMNLVTQGRENSAIIEDLARKQPSLIAICYPVQFADIHWLVFKSIFAPLPSRDGFRPQNFYKKIQAANRKKPIMVYDSQHVNLETIFKRVSGFQVELLLKKSCAILGCGSIGSRVAELMIKAGVGTMMLVDNDTLKVGNIARHILGLDYLGQNKAEAMREFLLKRNPFSNILAAPLDIVNGIQAFEEIVKRSDIVISCLGNDAAEFLVNLAAIEIGRPALFCRSYMRGLLGQILWSNGVNGACFQCVAEYLARAECPIPQPPKLPYDKLVKFDSDCGSAFIPASGIDLDLISLHCSRQALSFLQGEALEANYWLIRGRDFSNEEASLVAESVREPFRQHTYQITRDLGCAVCAKEK